VAFLETNNALRLRDKGEAMGQPLTFSAFDANRPGSAAWTKHAQGLWPHVTPLVEESTWTSEGQSAALTLFGEYMPELLPVLTALAAALDRPGGAAFLTHTTLKPFFAACSQTSIAGALLRNYDFDPQRCERTIVRSHYLRPIVGMNDLFWGLLDGMNDAGLAVSLTFGGRFVHGPGISTLLVVRYLLETCTSVDQAWNKLQTLPIATAHNLTLVDHEQAISVRLGPDIPATRADEVCITNHQHVPVPDEQESLTRTRQRLAALRAARATARQAPDPIEAIVQALLSPPLYNTTHGQGTGTLYTAAYRPAEGHVTYIWPGRRWEQSLDRFEPGSMTISVG
jgi:predicted choloylglycine hydrolase